MRISTKAYNLSAAIFIAAELSLAVIIQATSGRANSLISYFAVILALVFTLFRHTGAAKCPISLVAMAATACADLFLMVTVPQRPIVAMLFFSLVQAAYFLKIYLKTDDRGLRALHLFIRLFLLLTALIITLTVLGEGCDFLAVISVLYFVNLVLNLIFSFFIRKRSLLFSLGLFFFLLCDVFVGFGMMEPYIPISEGSIAYFLANPGFNAAWLFYVPAQTLLALSSDI